jgi:hypothetical protein
MAGITTIHTMDDPAYESEDEAFPPLPRTSPLRGYKAVSQKSKLADVAAVVETFSNSSTTAHQQWNTTKLASNEVTAAAALLGVGQSKSPTPDKTPYYLAPGASDVSSDTKIITLNTPATATKKLRSIRLVCQICKYETNHSSHMTRHMRAHTGNKPHACVHCDYRCSQKANLERHVRSRHTGLKPFGCPHCDYCSAQKSHIDGHIRSRHAEQMSLSCSERSYAYHDSFGMEQQQQQQQPQQQQQHAVQTYSVPSMSHFIHSRADGMKTSTFRHAQQQQQTSNNKRKFAESSSEYQREHIAFPPFDIQQMAAPPIKKMKPLFYTPITYKTRGMYEQNLMNHIDQTLLMMFTPTRPQPALVTTSPTGIYDLRCQENP